MKICTSSPVSTLHCQVGGSNEDTLELGFCRHRQAHRLKGTSSNERSAILLCHSLSLIEMVPEGAYKYCNSGYISSRNAGYWEKFSISNHHVSVKPH